MPRYIDADALKDVIQQHDYPLSDKLNSIDNGMFTLGIFQAIDQMPTVSLDEVRGVGDANMYDRLAAYEDTGLEPEELLNLKSGVIPAHWGDLFRAECDGRLVVLPCKVGDTVYTFYNGKNCKWPTNMKRRKIYETLVSGIRLHDWDADDWRLLLLFDTKEASGCYEFSFSEVGKTVFLTRAEAEAALKGVSEDA